MVYFQTRGSTGESVVSGRVLCGESQVSRLLLSTIFTLYCLTHFSIPIYSYLNIVTKAGHLNKQLHISNYPATLNSLLSCVYAGMYIYIYIHIYHVYKYIYSSCTK